MATAIGSQKIGELLDDPVDKMRRLFQEWEKRIHVGNLRISERYLSGEIELLLHLTGNCGPGDPAEFCAVIRNNAVETREGENELAGCRAAVRDLRRNIDVAEADDNQNLVLVGNVKVVNSPKNVTSGTVRLGGLDETYGTRMHSLYFSRVSNFLCGRTIINRKCIIPLDGVSIGLHEMTHQVIKGAPQIVYGVSGNQGKQYWRRLERRSLIDSLLSLKVILDDESIWVGLEKSGPLGLKLTDVVFGPFDFRPNLG